MNLPNIPPSWEKLLLPELNKPYMRDLDRFLGEEVAKNYEIYPPKELIFNALSATRPSEVKVVIIGQDPYHGPGQAEGLCFSVPENIPVPPSLKNIFKELQSEFKCPIRTNGNLSYLAKQGVLLLNATLTVRKGEPKSHFGKGWEIFTDKIVEILWNMDQPMAFLLWGKSAIDKVKNMNHPKKLVLKAPHPSPLSAYTGFFGCAHFSKANAFLKAHHLEEIHW
jgi:uracil-DNA glycosylase